jgi:hypothetical protein
VRFDDIGTIPADAHGAPLPPVVRTSARGHAQQSKAAHQKGTTVEVTR